MVKFISEHQGGYNRHQRDEGPPENLVEVGEVLHCSEDNQLLCKSTSEKVPWSTKMTYLENKAEVGTVDEVLGPVSNFMFSVIVGKNMKAESFEKGTKLYMSPAFQFDMDKFTNPNSRGRGGRGGRGGKPRGGGGSFRGRGGFSRGPSRGGSFNRGGPRGGQRGGRPWRARG